MDVITATMRTTKVVVLELDQQAALQVAGVLAKYAESISNPEGVSNRTASAIYAALTPPDESA